MHTHFVIHQGYAEDQSIACVTLSHDEGFGTPEEAMESFYSFLLTQAEARVERKPCCTINFDAFPEARFCMTCGSAQQSADTAEDLVETVWEEIWTGDIDSLGGDFFCDFEGDGWSFEWPEDEFAVVLRFERFIRRFEGLCEDDLLWMAS